MLQGETASREGELVMARQRQSIISAVGKIVCCKYCHTPKLQWRKVLGKWFLFTSDNMIHTCKSYRETNNEQINIKFEEVR